MRLFLENDDIKVEIESFGAELRSIVKKSTNTEYMWEADPNFWGKTSPILFPFIGKLEGNGYKYNDKFYEVTKHGFARDMEFEVCKEKSNKNKLVLAIKSNENTLKSFPFVFELEVEYKIEKDSVTESIRVINKDEKVMYFNVGGHPAFACPLIIDGKRTAARTDCKVKVYSENGASKFDITKMNIATGLLPGGTYELKAEDGVFDIAEHIFDNDALVIEDQKITAVGLLGADGKEYIRLESENCPVWGIWSMPTSEASYVCVEPWWGICDAANYAGTLQERPYTNQVEPGSVWENGFKITVK